MGGKPLVVGRPGGTIGAVAAEVVVVLPQITVFVDEMDIPDEDVVDEDDDDENDEDDGFFLLFLEVVGETSSVSQRCTLC